MKIIRDISSTRPELCNMVVRGWFGNVKGEVKYANYPIDGIGGKRGYFIIRNDEMVGAATDFYHACDALLNELGIVKTTFV
jgi:hypothetical protein